MCLLCRLQETVPAQVVSPSKSFNNFLFSALLSILDSFSPCKNVKVKKLKRQTGRFKENALDISDEMLTFVLYPPSP